LNHLLIKICSACCKDKSKFITKTEAKKGFFLTTEDEFDSLFSFISHNRRYYLMEDVRARALCKYGSEDAFKRRHRQFSERSEKIKLGKEMTRARRRRHQARTEVGPGVLTGVLASGASFSEERVKLALMVLGLIPRSLAAVGDLMQLFNINGDPTLRT